MYRHFFGAQLQRNIRLRAAEFMQMKMLTLQGLPSRKSILIARLVMCLIDVKVLFMPRMPRSFFRLGPPSLCTFIFPTHTSPYLILNRFFSFPHPLSSNSEKHLKIAAAKAERARQREAERARLMAEKQQQQFGRQASVVGAVSCVLCSCFPIYIYIK